MSETSCERAGELLVDSWNDDLEPAARRELESHLASCESCREEAARLGEVWRDLGGVGSHAPGEVPSERLRARFYAALAEHQAALGGGRRVRSVARWLAALWPTRPELQMASAAAALVVGIGLGALIFGLNGTRAEIGELRGELASMSRTVGLALLDHQSASERLRGVAWSSHALSDPRTVDALLDVATRDPNVNVRLAAVEALAGRAKQPEVRTRLIASLPAQTAPLLQAAVLELLLGSDPGSLDELRELLDSESLDPGVREEILQSGDPV